MILLATVIAWLLLQWAAALWLSRYQIRGKHNDLDH